MDIPQPPKLPTRSKVWHGAHTQEEFKIYERELDEYLKQLAEAGIVIESEHYKDKQD